MRKTQHTAHQLESASIQEDDDLHGQYDLYEQIGHLLRRAHQRASSDFAEHMGDFDITPVQFAALVQIHNHVDVSQNALGRITAIDQATMHGVIARLKERKLVRSRPDPEDGRRNLLSLSPAGKRLVNKMTPQAFNVSRQTLSALNSSEQSLIVALLKKLATD